MRSRSNSIFFDHSYTNDPNHRFLKKLEKLGFRLDPHQTEHPGKHYCRFIMFPARNGLSRNYLEFVRVGRSGRKLQRPGFSLGSSAPLEKLWLTLKKEKNLSARYAHKNYDWKKDSKSRLPGWNFLDFKNLKIRGFFPWLTEYEPSSDKKRKKRKYKAHPNGVHEIKAIHFELNARGAKFFSKVLGTPVRDRVTLSCGTQLFLSSGRSNRFRAIVLGAKDLEKFSTRSKLAARDDFFGQPACRISNSEGWDLLVVES